VDLQDDELIKSLECVTNDQSYEIVAPGINPTTYLDLISSSKRQALKAGNFDEFANQQTHRSKSPSAKYSHIEKRINETNTQISKIQAKIDEIKSSSFFKDPYHCLLKITPRRSNN
jgi:hypothetical protein